MASRRIEAETRRFDAQIAFARVATALAVVSVGGLAVGSMAVGAVAIGRLALRRGWIGSLAIEDVEVGRLRVRELIVEREEGDEQDAFALLVEVARDGVERGEFVPLPPATIALAAWAMVHGFVMLELNGKLTSESPPAQTLRAAAGGEPPSLDDLFAAALELCATGLLRR